MNSQDIRRIRWRVGMVAGGLVALMISGVLTAVGAQAATGCRVAYTVSSQWPSGFTADVGITNLGDPINGWSLVWTFPSGQRVTQAWNATVTTVNARHAGACRESASSAAHGLRSTHPIAAAPITLGTAKTTNPHTP